MKKKTRMDYIDRIRREAARDWNKLISTDSTDRRPTAGESPAAPPADVSSRPEEEHPAP